MDEFKQKGNKIKNMDINSNLSDFYALLASLVINLNLPQNSLQSYFNFLMLDEELQIMLSRIFDSASAIAMNSYKVKKSLLPFEYFQEPWRSRKLITCIFENQPRTINSLQEMISFWQKEDAMYI